MYKYISSNFNVVVFFLSIRYQTLDSDERAAICFGPRLLVDLDVVDYLRQHVVVIAGSSPYCKDLQDSEIRRSYIR